MKKYIYFLIFIILFMPISVFGMELIDTNSNSVVLYDIDDDKILFDRNGDEIRNVASLTKIVTCITAIDLISEKGIDFDEKVTVKYEHLKDIDVDASVAGLKVGDVVTYRDLLYAILLPSGADSSNVIAFSLCGSVDEFVKNMNSLANRLGCSNSNFVNTTGLDIDNHYSTANDILNILKYAYSNELFLSVYSSKEYTLSNGLKVKSTLKKYNLDSSRIIGSKTGYTGKAGTCFSFYFKSNGHSFLGVSLGAKYVYGDGLHIKDAINIIDFMDNNFNNQILVDSGKFNKDIIVHWSKIKSIKLSNKNAISLYLPNDYDKSLFRYEYIGLDEIYPNYDISHSIGKVNYYYDNKLIDSEDLFIKDDIKFNLFRFVVENYIIFSIVIIVCIFIVLVKYKGFKFKIKVRRRV